MYSTTVCEKRRRREAAGGRLAGKCLARVLFALVCSLAVREWDVPVLDHVLGDRQTEASQHGLPMAQLPSSSEPVFAACRREARAPQTPLSPYRLAELAELLETPGVGDRFRDPHPVCRTN